MKIFKSRFITEIIKGIHSVRYNSTTSIKKYRIIFFGSDDVSLTSLKKINELFKSGDCVKHLKLVTANRSNIPSKIEKYAHAEKLNILSWPVKDLKKNEFDLGIVVSFGHLIPEETISKCTLGVINVHTSLFPRWRGAAPVIQTLLNGDKITGVSLMSIKPHCFDTGEIISQESIEVTEDVTLPVLTKQLAELGAAMLVKCLRNLPECLANARPQSEEGVTYARKINKSISLVKWSEMSARDVYNLHRAIHGLYSLSTLFKNKEVKLFEPFLDNETTDCKEQSPGYIEYCKKTNSIKVLCKDSRYVCFKKLRILGKREISAFDFYNGYMKKNNENDCVFY